MDPWKNVDLVATVYMDNVGKIMDKTKFLSTEYTFVIQFVELSFRLQHISRSSKVQYTYGHTSAVIPCTIFIHVCLNNEYSTHCKQFQNFIFSACHFPCIFQISHKVLVHATDGSFKFFLINNDYYFRLNQPNNKQQLAQ